MLEEHVIKLGLARTLFPSDLATFFFVFFKEFIVSFVRAAEAFDMFASLVKLIVT